MAQHVNINEHIALCYVTASLLYSFVRLERHESLLAACGINKQTNKACLGAFLLCHHHNAVARKSNSKKKCHVMLARRRMENKSFSHNLIPQIQRQQTATTTINITQHAAAVAVFYDLAKRQDFCV